MRCFYLTYLYICRSTESMMLPLAIIPGPKKPKYLMSFLKPIIEEINTLSTKGFIVEKNDHVVHQSKVFLLGITGDIPGIADLMNHSGHMSNYGCRYCLVTGCHPEGTSHGMYFRGRGNMRTREHLISGGEVI